MYNITLAKFISKILRHKPNIIGITLDDNGWAEVDELIAGINRADLNLTREILNNIVENDTKTRFAFNKDQSRIRANQGHSIQVDVELKEQVPPNTLYHGTVERFVDNIFEKGLISKNRLYVHLSSDIETAVKVGSRRGEPVILEVNAGKMADDGNIFYLSANGVWLTESVPPTYIKRLIR